MSKWLVKAAIEVKGGKTNQRIAMKFDTKEDARAMLDKAFGKAKDGRWVDHFGQWFWIEEDKRA